jgi:hypothetical protein
LVEWDAAPGLDVVHQLGHTFVLSGLDGSELGRAATGLSYGTVTPYDVDADGAPELTIHEGFYPRLTVDDDLLTTLWHSNALSTTTPGAVARCSPAPRLFEATQREFGLVESIALGGAAAGQINAAVFAGGQRFSTRGQALSAGVQPSKLGPSSVHNNLAGDQQPIAVFGAEDGWLYGVNACTLELAFAYDFGMPVGVAIFGDTDADGNDEIVVSVADGHLYGMKQAVLPAPSVVKDRDRWLFHRHRRSAAEDIDELYTRCSLFTSFSKVPGATSYEVAVIKPDGSPLLEPAWRNVGRKRAVALRGLELEEGARYTIAVRARNRHGVSPDTLSDGVTVHGVQRCKSRSHGHHRKHHHRQHQSGGRTQEHHSQADASLVTSSHSAGTLAPYCGFAVYGPGATRTAPSSAKWVAPLLCLLALVARRRRVR